MKSSIQDVLHLTKQSENCFRAVNHKENFNQTLFGGQVLAQALMAAGLTVDKIPPHSMHAYFLRTGSRHNPVDYVVARNRDGRSFSHRTVNAMQNGETIFTAMISFHCEENGFEHSLSWSKTPLPPCKEVAAPPSGFAPEQPELSADSFEFHALTQGMFSSESTDAISRFWMRNKEVMAPDRLLQSCVLAYASDFGLLASSLAPHPISLFHGEILGASVDHAIWFHNASFSTNDWLLYEIESPWAGGARGFAQGKIFDMKGVLLATTTQEGLIRPKGRKNNTLPTKA